jgi:G3E family GTPase
MSGSLPVTIVTGFLGAGKTTLVNRWLQTAKRGEMAVVVNEYGAVGVDGELLAARVQQLFEVTGGCFCCTTQAELVQALDSLATSETPPERILIETSGAASPAGVLRAIMGGGKCGRLILDGVVAVFDVTRVDDVLEQGVAREQLGFADVLVLSRVETSTREGVARAARTLEQKNGAAVVLESANGEILSPPLTSLNEVLLQRRTGFVSRPVEVASESSHAYESVSLSLDGQVDGERFADFVETELAACAGRLFRVKGILAVANLEQRMIVQGVADTLEVTFGEVWGESPRNCRLVVVGFALEPETLKSGFEKCREPH